jgi:hypothetical protein
LNNQQILANRLSSKYDYQQNPSIYKDLSSEDIDNSESPTLIGSNNLYTPDNDETISRDLWSRLSHRHNERSIFTPRFKSGYGLRSGQIRYIPYPAQKRAIPIELQKALFAHGIVGRRR